jgi:hypothetical protein
MTLQNITYSQFREAIRASFSKDEDIKKFYDTNIVVNSVEDIVEDIYKKVFEYNNYDGKLIIKGAYDGEDLIGYVAVFNNLLISFALAVERRKSNGTEFFELIKKELNSNFFCFLWSINVRATKFLEKHGMKTIFSDNQIIKLQCR